ncbi:uncharacterized protein LOC130903096 [Diorhabda carinulata]|uniref:uncharacterized protein LOC130903096 n=1 Tax=Diorhabda carinulata TaxID=1163345 RepID=UPI0025A14366|nr:uncharacterized protein LOC130903096 [Diorhabda carinulata]
MSAVRIQLVKELHKPIGRNYPRRRTIIKGLDDLWQMDLAEMIPYAKHNRGFKMILVVIDCFSKFVWTRPLKTKTAEEITRAFSSIIKGGRMPKNVQSDQGTEFYNTKFKTLMKKHNINHYSTFSTKKAAIAERVIRTLKTKLYKHFSLIGKYKWIIFYLKIQMNTTTRNILLNYENAIRQVKHYLLHRVFNVVRFMVGYSLSPVRNFAPVIILSTLIGAVESIKMSFNTFEWEHVIDALRKSKEEYFNSPDNKSPIDSNLL